MKPLKQRLENVGKKLAEEKHRLDFPVDLALRSTYQSGFSALSGIVVELAEALYDYRHIPAPGDRVTQYSSAAEAIAKLDAFLDKEGK